MSEKKKPIFFGLRKTYDASRGRVDRIGGRFSELHMVPEKPFSREEAVLKNQKKKEKKKKMCFSDYPYLTSKSV
jgi:hypothetical protein